MADNGDTGLLSAGRVCELTGCSFRQLDYWSREGLLHPTQPARGHGRWRGWSIDDVATVALVKDLQAWGVKGARLRRLLAALRAEPKLWGQTVVITRDGAVRRLGVGGLDGGLVKDLAALRAATAELAQVAPVAPLAALA